MRFTRVRDLAAIAVVVGLLSYLASRQFYAVLPEVPKLAGTTLAAIALIELVLGFSLRARIQRKRGMEPIQPLAAARAVALAKASSVLGAIMLGAWAGFLTYIRSRPEDLPSVSGDTAAAIIGGLCALALIGAALWLEYCCKTPKGPDDPDRDGRT